MPSRFDQLFARFAVPFAKAGVLHAFAELESERSACGAVGARGSE